MDRPIILFLDDDAPIYISHFADKLKRELLGYDYVVLDNVDNAWSFVEANKDRLQLLVLDLIMPPCRLFASQKTGYGCITGMLFLQKLRKLLPALPVVVFTICSGLDISRRAKVKLDQRVELIRKPCFPGDFAELCVKFLRRCTPTPMRLEPSR